MIRCGWEAKYLGRGLVFKVFVVLVAGPNVKGAWLLTMTSWLAENIVVFVKHAVGLQYWVECALQQWPSDCTESWT